MLNGAMTCGLCGALLTQLQLSSPSIPSLGFLEATPHKPPHHQEHHHHCHWSPQHTGGCCVPACGAGGSLHPPLASTQPGCLPQLRPGLPQSPRARGAQSPAHVPVPLAEHPPKPAPSLLAAWAGHPPACKPTATYFACLAVTPLAFLRRLLLHQGFYWDSYWTRTVCLCPGWSY